MNLEERLYSAFEAIGANPGIGICGATSYLS
jgi:hypothetical protein